MEVLRAELAATNIGTTCFVPGLTTSNIGQSESHRPEDLRNAAPASGAAAGGAPRGGGGGAAARGGGAGGAAARGGAAAAATTTPYWSRPQDPVVVGRIVLDAILHNDLYVVLQPEWRPGVEARANALMESMVPLQPVPESIASAAPDRYLRTPIYAQEIAHRRATRNRNISGI
jgi:hypothetical protein